MTRPDLALRVDDLVGHPERRRGFSGSREVSLRLGDSSIRSSMTVTGEAVGTMDGVQVDYRATAPAQLSCVRCLASWVEELVVADSQHFSKTPDEDGYAIVGGEIDLAGPATDELALGLPLVPVCRPACKGLCPTCGTDLNEAPCDGHGEDLDSPFAALRDLFDPSRSAPDGGAEEEDVALPHPPP